MMRKCKSCGTEHPFEHYQITDKRRGYRRHECRECYCSRQRRYYSERTEEYKGRSTSMNAMLHRKAVEAYGGKCACCGETEWLFLTIDHINNDGAERRKTEHGSGTTFYRWLRNNDYPEDFQVLCYNCNLGKHRNGGVCPHKEGSETIP